MNNNQFILKIMKNNFVFLHSVDAHQELCPLSDLKIKRGFDNKCIQNHDESQVNAMMYKSVVQTNDAPDIAFLELGAIYKIYSIIPFRQNKIFNSELVSTRDRVPGSTEDYDDFIIYRPIFSMYLTNYNVNSSSKFKWFMEFEEA